MRDGLARHARFDASLPNLCRRVRGGGRRSTASGQDDAGVHVPICSQKVIARSQTPGQIDSSSAISDKSFANDAARASAWRCLPTRRRGRLAEQY
jgi:hypothetical protein